MISKRNKAVRYAYERGYRVMENGDVISLSGRKLKPGIGSQGYFQFSIRIPGLSSRKYPVRVHRLLAYQKFGDALLEPGIQVRHLDGNPLNNSWENITIGTQSENQMDIPQEVRIARGRNAARHNSHLTDKDVLDIRAMFAEGATGKEIARKYGITESAASRIKNRKRYKHL